MKLEPIIQSEVSQKDKDEYSIYEYIYKYILYTNIIYEYIIQMHIYVCCSFIFIEIKLNFIYGLGPVTILNISYMSSFSIESKP